MLKEITYHQDSGFLDNLSRLSNGPHELMLEMGLKADKIGEFRLGPIRFFLVTDPELVREILVTKAKLFPKWDRDVKIIGRFLGQGLVTSLGEHHKKQRKMSQPAFHMSRIASYADVMSTYTTDMLDKWPDDGVLDVSQEMFRLTMYIVTKTIFDVDKDVMAEQADRVGEAIHRLQKLTDLDISNPVDWPEWLPTKLNIRRRRERRVLDKAIKDILDARTTGGAVEDRGDLLSMLLLAREEDPAFLNDKEMRDQVVTLFAAGHETTSNTLAWTWYALSQNPEVMARLQAEADEVLGGRLPTYEDLDNLPYNNQVIKESMRVKPSVWTLNTRIASEETSLGEYRVKKGSYMFISPYVLQNLPQHFSEPEIFDPERFSPENEKEIAKYSYLPFGGGPRVCIGQGFAMMEARLILATMIQQFDFELMPDQEVVPLTLITMSIRDGLKMRVTRRRRPEKPQETADLLAA